MDNQNTFIIERIYNAPIKLLWQVITQREHLKQWYFDFAEDWKLEIGAQFEWSAEDTKCHKWVHKGEMIEIIPDKKLVHSWAYPGFSGNSILCWELEEIDALHTKIKLTHFFETPFDSTIEELRMENFVAGWNEILTKMLSDYLTKIVQ